MARQYLIDSNAVIDFLSGKLPGEGLSFMKEVVNEIPKISVISKIEVLGFNSPDAAYQLLNDFINVALIIDFSEEVVGKTIELRKQQKIKIPDAIVAATAIVFDLILVTRNMSDFKNISGLQILNPWDIK